MARVIDERPETVLSIAALRTGFGTVWENDQAILVESALVPGEPQGFGDPMSLLDLLEEADGWTCVAVSDDLARAVEPEFERRFGLARVVVDVVHTLDQPVRPVHHPLVRSLTVDDVESLVDADGVLPAPRIVRAAAAARRCFVAVYGEVVVGHGSSFAWGEQFADVGVHVSERWRRKGLARATASQACQAVQSAGLTPVWGCGADNQASMALAAGLGFKEVARLSFLVRRR